MPFLIVLGLSILCQLTAAILALRLIKVTGKSNAWFFIAGAVILMVARRVFILIQVIQGDPISSDMLVQELIALITSIFLAIGIGRIGPAFVSAMSGEAALRLEERKQAAERYRLVADYTFDWEFWLSPERKLVYSSPSCERISGYTREEFLANSNLLEEIVHPDDLAIYRQHVQEFHNVAGEVSRFQYRILDRDGQVKLISHLCRPIFDQDGKYMGRRGSNRDVTNEKILEADLEKHRVHLEEMVAERTLALAETNQRLSEEIAERKLVEGELARIARFPSENPNPVLRVDGQGKILYANDAGQALLAEWRDQAGEKIPPDWVKQIQAALAEGAGQARDVSIGEQTFSLYIAPVVEAGYVNLYGQDVTARQAAEAENRRLNAELELRVYQRTIELEIANKELEAFSYSVSHDLRAPLRAIDGFSRILTEEYQAELPAEAQRFLHLVRENAGQMGQLIDDLLAFSRLGRQAIQFQDVLPDQLVRQALETLQVDRLDRAIVVKIAGLDGGDHLPACRADRNLLRQVFVNLLGNAIKFTAGRDPAVIEIGAKKIGQEIVYYIQDNGVGFEMQYAEKIFGVFQRLHRSEEYSGNGVGLAIVQRIIRRHGGRIWAEGEVGRGATFFFTLGGELTDD